MVFTWVANAHRSLDEEISKLNHSFSLSFGHLLLAFFVLQFGFRGLKDVLDGRGQREVGQGRNLG